MGIFTGLTGNVAKFCEEAQRKATAVWKWCFGNPSPSDGRLQFPVDVLICKSQLHVFGWRNPRKNPQPNRPTTCQIRPPPQPIFFPPPSSLQVNSNHNTWKKSKAKPPLKQKANISSRLPVLCCMCVHFGLGMNKCLISCPAAHPSWGYKKPKAWSQIYTSSKLSHYSFAKTHQGQLLSAHLSTKAKTLISDILSALIKPHQVFGFDYVYETASSYKYAKTIWGTMFNCLATHRDI